MNVLEFPCGFRVQVSEGDIVVGDLAQKVLQAGGVLQSSDSVSYKAVCGGYAAQKQGEELWRLEVGADNFPPEPDKPYLVNKLPEDRIIIKYDHEEGFIVLPHDAEDNKYEPDENTVERLLEIKRNGLGVDSDQDESALMESILENTSDHRQSETSRGIGNLIRTEWMNALCNSLRIPPSMMGLDDEEDEKGPNVHVIDETPSPGPVEIGPGTVLLYPNTDQILLSNGGSIDRIDLKEHGLSLTKDEREETQ